MSTQQEKEKKRDIKRQEDKTYAELLYEAQDASAKVAKVYVRQLCEAKRREDYPKIDMEISSVESIKKMCDNIKAEVINDCSWWSTSTIQHVWPDWIKDEYYVDLRKARTEKDKLKVVATIATQEQKSALENEKEFNLVGSIMHDIKLPKISQEDQEQEEPTQSEIEDIEIMRPLGENKKDLMDLYADINKPAMDLFKGLIGQNKLPGPTEDLINDYVKGTREFRKSLVLELQNQNSLSLNGLQRILAEVDYVIDDMLEIIEQVQKKK